jgi:hypothetical protein
MRGRRTWIAATIVAVIPVAAGAGDQDCRRLMVEGKLRADLGEHDQASAAFRAVAEDEAAPSSLRWEALVRLGLARSAAGDPAASAHAFRSVLVGYSEDPAAMRFLMQAVASSVPGKIWIDFKEEFEELLRTARVVSSEELGPGAPKKVTLAAGEGELSGIWKPRWAGDSHGRRISHRSEVAAYEIDKILGLDMVPPTVLRTLEGTEGSLQLWVYGCETLGVLRDRVPDTSEWRRQISRMTTFDQIIGNRDRNQGNILVDPDWEIVLIDHSLSFWEVGEVLAFPDRFDRRLVDQLRQLRPTVLQAQLEGLLTPPQIEGLMKRRDALVAHVDALVEESGEQAVFF